MANPDNNYRKLDARKRRPNWPLRVLVLVLICLGGIGALRNREFPTMIPPGKAVPPVVSPAPELPQEVRPAGIERGGAGEDGELEAVLTAVGNRVQIKGADAIAWETAGTGVELSFGDAIRTLEDSQGEIRLGQHNLLHLESNSLVIFRPPEQDRGLSEEFGLRVLVEGKLSGKVAAGGKEGLGLEFMTPHALARFEPAEGTGGDAEFTVSVQRAQSSSIAVWSGTARVGARGKTVVVGANQGVLIRSGQAPSDPAPLPAAPSPIAPVDAQRARYRDLPPKMHFTWSRVPKADQYRFVLAADPGFKKILVDEVVRQTEFFHGNLTTGSYFWRISSLLQGSEGRPGRSMMLNMVQDRRPPLLTVGIPSLSLQPQLSLSGRTEPGAKVFVDGVEFSVNSTGEFSGEIELKQSLNSILVESVDEAGNIAYQSGLVQRKF